MKKEIIFADSFPMVRIGFKTILNQTPDMILADEASNGQELLQKLNERKYDMVAFETVLSDRDGFDLQKEIKGKWPGIPIIVFCDSPESGLGLRMIRAGVSACISKQMPPDALIDVFRSVSMGKKYLTQSQIDSVTEMLSNSGKLDDPLHDQLTDREFQILFMLAAGMRKSVIASKLQLSKNTVGNHRNNILRKLKLSSNSEITRYAFQNGLIR